MQYKVVNGDVVHTICCQAAGQEDQLGGEEQSGHKRWGHHGHPGWPYPQLQQPFLVSGG